MKPETVMAMRLWESLGEGDHAHHFKGFLHLPSVLFHQTALAFDGGAHVGASLLCRSVLEAAMYLFVTREKGEQPRGAWRLRAPVTLDGRFRRVTFEELRLAIVKGRILPDELNVVLERIQDRGNIAAHMASRLDSYVLDSYSSRNGKALNVWVTEEEAWEDLQDTANILDRLAYILDELPEWAGPQPRKRVIRVQTVVPVRSVPRSSVTDDKDEISKGG